MSRTLKLRVIESRRSQSLKFAMGSRRVIQIGRLMSAHVTIETPGAARLHAAIQLDRQHAILTDISGGRQTRVNGEPIVRRQLAHGDIISIGNTVIQVDLSTVLQETLNPVSTPKGVRQLGWPGETMAEGRETQSTQRDATHDPRGIYARPAAQGCMRQPTPQFGDGGEKYDTALLLRRMSTARRFSIAKAVGAVVIAATVCGLALHHFSGALPEAVAQPLPQQGPAAQQSWATTRSELHAP